MNEVAVKVDGYYAFTIGRFGVTALSDGVLTVPLQNFPLATAERAGRLLHDPEPAGVPVQVNGFLVRTAKQRILFDTGCGSAVAPKGSRLLDNLAAVGLGAADIDLVVLSHMHIDHIGGLVEGGAPVFGNARLLVSRLERDYWRQDGFPEQAPERQKRSAEIAVAVERAYGERISTFEPGTEIVEGIRSVALPGHTPGHTGFMIADGGEALFIWGDIVHSATLQFAEPGWNYGADVDRAEAQAHREWLLGEYAESGGLVAGMHLPFPGVGRVGRDGGGYRFLPGVA